MKTIIYLAYLLCWFLIWWGYSGYVIFLYLNRKGQRVGGGIREYPSVTIIVPCYNEENLIKQKIENLLDLEYQKDKLEIIIVDGGSTDKTTGIIVKEIQRLSNIQFIRSDKKGKIYQINLALKRVKGDIIVNTDADTILEKNALIEIAKEFHDETAGVVGAFVIPENCSNEESIYWLRNNQFRILETLAYSSSIVVAPCYAYRKDLLTKFPDEVVADDIYTAFTAIAKGFKVIYSKDIIAYETRTPKSDSEFIKHKLRKANAFLKEIFRFSKYLPKFHNRWKIIFLTKFMQLVLIPFMIPLSVILSILVLYNNPFLLLATLFPILLSIIISGNILSRTIIPSYMNSGMLTDIKIVIMSNLILIYSLLVYPFYRQTSSYEKIE